MNINVTENATIVREETTDYSAYADHFDAEQYARDVAEAYNLTLEEGRVHAAARARMEGRDAVARWAQRHDRIHSDGVMSLVE